MGLIPQGSPSGIPSRGSPAGALPQGSPSGLSLRALPQGSPSGLPRAPQSFPEEKQPQIFLERKPKELNIDQIYFLAPDPPRPSWTLLDPPRPSWTLLDPTRPLREKRKGGEEVVGAATSSSPLALSTNCPSWTFFPQKSLEQ